MKIQKENDASSLKLTMKRNFGGRSKKIHIIIIPHDMDLQTYLLLIKQYLNSLNLF